MTNRTVASGWLKIHVGCGGQVVYRENPNLIRTYNYDFGFECLDCDGEPVAEQVLEIHEDKDLPSDVTLVDFMEEGIATRRELSIPQTEEELKAQREKLAEIF